MCARARVGVCMSSCGLGISVCVYLCSYEYMCLVAHCSESDPIAQSEPGN